MKKLERFIEQIISIPLWCLILPGIFTTVHWKMVKDHPSVKRLKKATYREIRDKMLDTNWYIDSFKPSLFTHDDSAYFHADIFRFGDVGYLLTPYGYLRACALQRKIAKELDKVNEKPYI